MTVGMKFPNSAECSYACGAFSELCQALKIDAVKRIEASGLTMTVTLEVCAQFPRAPILAMFGGLEQYYLDRAPLDGFIADVQATRAARVL